MTTSACDQLLAESLQRMELPDYEGSPDQREVTILGPHGWVRLAAKCWDHCTGLL